MATGLITSRKVGGDLLTFVAKCDKGWVGCFWILMSHLLKQLKIEPSGCQAFQNILHGGPLLHGFSTRGPLEQE